MAAGLLPSDDTLEILKDPKLPDRVSRVALWLPHASLEEVQEFWNHLMENPAVPDELIVLVMARWVALDPAGAIKAKRPGLGPSRAWEAWAYSDPKAAHRAAVDSGDDQIQMLVMQAIASRDPDYVLKLMEEGDMASRRSASRVVDAFLAQRSYERAMDVTLRFSSGLNKDKIFREWAKQDAAEALKWGLQQPKLVSTINKDDELMRDIARQNEAAVPEILAKLPAGDIKQRLQGAYVKALAERDPEVAMRFASDIGSPLLRDNLLGTIGASLAGSKPEAAAGILSKLLDEGRSLGEHPVIVFFPEGSRQWTSTESPLDGFGKALVERMPEQALDTAMQNAEKPAYRKAALQLADMAMERDAWDFGGWLDRQPAGGVRDELILHFSSHLVEEGEPAYAEALSWAAAMSDARQRDEQLSDLLSRWKSKDPEAYRKYVADPKTPEAIRALSTPSESR
ncbi:hypothetical protein WKV53_03295 [Luteolibacter sp. Y139]|uniref:HEAT repeat domain-containing protein n=2 Tax=Luteolibacter soli TaxID=3135280 RepID=A0ABU9APP7_9BACT